jgi:alpha-tubulin suppressor-like RCC1 family protein/serine/threonine protein kinase
MTSLAQPLEAGAIVAQDYRVERPLARGGMGSLYVVTQLSTGHERALKVMHARLLRDPRGRDRFLQEARASARIQSDHVVQVMAAGFDDGGIPWMVMELLRGEDLAAALERRGRFGPEEALVIFRQLGHALGAAHEAGLIHRDLKPENIFLADTRREGVPFTVKLLDFGIAKVLAEAQGEGLNTSAVGTPLWMAPEQASKGTITAASDVWSVGLVAFNVLTGKRYWKVGNEEGVPLERVLRELFVDPLEPASARAALYGRTLPGGFDAWFARCVCREPRERFPNAHAAVAALVPVLLGPMATQEAKAVHLGATTPDQPPVAPVAPVAPRMPPTMLSQPTGDGPLNPWQMPSQAEHTPLSAHYSAPAPPPPSAPRTVVWDPNSPPPSTGAGPFPVSGPLAPQPTGPGMGQSYPGMGQSHPGTGPSYQGTGPHAPVHAAPAPRPTPTWVWGIMVVVLGGLGVGTYLVVERLHHGDPEPERPTPRTPPQTPRTPPQTPPPTPRLATPRAPGTLAVGFSHTCAIARDTTVRCWGWNAFGQLGDGSVAHRTAPTPVAGLVGAVELVAGYAHTCARLNTGEVRCWGLNSTGQLGDGTRVSRVVPTPVPGALNATQLTLGDGHTCARFADGSARCWGCNGSGQVGDGTADDRLVPTPVVDLAGVEEIAAGDAHTCARLRDGSARCWGHASFGQVGDGHLALHFRPAPVSSLTRTARLALGPYRTCAIDLDGAVSCWGRNENGQLGDGTRTSRSTPVRITTLTAADDLCLASFHTCALGPDASLRCWGNNPDGRLGDGTTQDRPRPVALLGLGPVAAVSAQESHTCARLRDQSVRCWGANGIGQLGDGTLQSRLAPTGVAVP